MSGVKLLGENVFTIQAEIKNLPSSSTLQSIMREVLWDMNKKYVLFNDLGEDDLSILFAWSYCVYEE